MDVWIARLKSPSASQVAAVAVAALVVTGIIGSEPLALLFAGLFALWWFWHVMTFVPLTRTQTFTRITGEYIAAPVAQADNSDTVIQTNVTIDGLVRASQAINEVTAMQSESAREQAQVIQLANNLLEDYIMLTERINDQARQVTRTANQSASMSDSGQAAIEQTIASMDDIRTQVGAIGETIVRLGELTRRIDDIITSVSEIATQSNLLALNASIEAARAGAQGRGFAVVANEVRALAGQSTQSAEQVRVILGEIQSAMRETIKATQQGIANVEVGLSRTHTAREVMMQLAQSVNESRQAVSEISQVLHEQSKGMEEIAISMGRIQRITQQSLDSTRTVEMVSSNLSRLANDLVEVSS
jgi:methyl-accepting chemotaxis protein